MSYLDHTTSGLTLDAYFHDAANLVRVASSGLYVTWVDADYATYRHTATERGISGDYEGAIPSGAARVTLRIQGASLVLSVVKTVREIVSPTMDAMLAEIKASADEAARPGDAMTIESSE